MSEITCAKALQMRDARTVRGFLGTPACHGELVAW